MGRDGGLDYARLTKGGVVLGVSLFLLGAGGESLIHAMSIQVPAWEETLLFDLEVVGLLTFAVSPFLFGVFLPLTE